MTKIPVSTAVRQLQESELDEADAICRSAFNTFVGVPDLFGDQDYIHTRWKAAPEHAIAVEVDGRLAGSNFITRWGSFGFFGPLSVRPELWDQGLAKAVMETTVDILAAANVSHAGLFTFGHSPKHVGLYQHFGFWPRFLTPILSKSVHGQSSGHSLMVMSGLDEAGQGAAANECRALTNEIHPGLDLQREIDAAGAQGLGDVVLVGGDRVDGFAVCHLGPGTEAGGGSCYVKFGAARSPGAFGHLLDACEQLGHARGARQVQMGVNTSREDAYKRVVARGYRPGLIGVAMQKPNAPGWNRTDAYVIDDWR